MKQRFAGGVRALANVACWCVVLSIVGLASASALAAEKLRFVTLEFAPFIYGENQQVAGPGRDVIAAVCEEANIDCSFDIYPWRRAQELIRDGEADGMMVIGRNPEREEWLWFSPPLFRTEYGFFVSAENPLEFEDLSQIAGYRVGVFAPSNTATQLEGIRDQMVADGIDPIEIDQRPDDAAGLRKLAAGRLDAVYSNRDRGDAIIRDERLSAEVRYAGPHQAIFYYAGVTKTFPDRGLVDHFLDAWRRLFANGVAQSIIEGYGLEPGSEQ
ncbi:MAG: transporter substrate-binding domain-containing protein [Pseudomonadota bacterium]